jgi:hypothetical protein
MDIFQHIIVSLVLAAIVLVAYGFWISNKEFDFSMVPIRYMAIIDNRRKDLNKRILTMSNVQEIPEIDRLLDEVINKFDRAAEFHAKFFDSRFFFWALFKNFGKWQRVLPKEQHAYYQSLMSALALTNKIKS